MTDYHKKSGYSLEVTVSGYKIYTCDYCKAIGGPASFDVVHHPDCFNPDAVIFGHGPFYPGETA